MQTRHLEFLSTVAFKSVANSRQLLGSAVVLAVAGGAMAAAPQRPYYNFANNHGYVLYQAPAANSVATAAQADAVAAGGHLVTVSDAAEDAFIRNTFDGTINPGVPSTGVGSVAGYWIGLTDDPAFGRTEGNFGWMSGEAVGYTNWAAPNPDNWGAGENFVGKGANAVANGGQWIDVPDTFGGSVAGLAEIATPRAVADNFDGRAEGSALNGAGTQVGGRNWAATHAVVTSGAGKPVGAITPSTVTGIKRLLADAPLDLAADTRLISVQIDGTISSGTAGNGTWCFLGLSENSLDPMRPSQGGTGDALSLKFSADGTINVYARDGETTVLNQLLTMPAGFTWSRGQMFSYQLVFDALDNTADVYINNIPFVTDLALGFAPSFTCGGFQAEKNNIASNLGTDAAWFDNYASLVVTPEPATALLVVLGGLALLRRKH